jgi:hypothetical protein
MGLFIDRTGQRFGKLTVIRRLLNDKVNQAVWLCKCDCGKEKTYRASNLHSKTSMSCGCSHKKKPFLWIYNKLLKRAELRNLKCDLNYEDFISFTTINECYYCGSHIKWAANPIRKVAYTQRYNIDRLNNNLGYTKNNCVVCCWECNCMKRNRSDIQFINHCNKIVQYRKILTFFQNMI